MNLVSMLLLLALTSASPAQEPPLRVDPTKPSTTQLTLRQPKDGESVVEGLLLRVECPRGQPVRFTMRANDKVERFESVRLGDVDYIAYTPDFKGPMTCGGRGKGDRVRLTWTKAGKARRVVAIEFLPAK